MLPYLIGLVLSVAVAVFARLVGSIAIELFIQPC